MPENRDPFKSIPPGRRFRSWVVWPCAALLFSAALHAQQSCDVQAKLLLSPSQTNVVVTALHARNPTQRQIYFFDTKGLDLLSQGVILRLRQGVNNDLTVKLRPGAGKQYSDPLAGLDAFQCEVDMTGSGAVRSYAIQSNYAGRPVPVTGTELFAALSPGQRKLLEEAQAHIDWSQVTRIVDIRSTLWRIKARHEFKDMPLELWQWRNGAILELSTRANADAGQATYTAMQQLVKNKGLSLDSVQELKTTVVLHQAAKGN